MKKIILLLFFTPWLAVAQEETNFTYHTYSEFVEMIQQEEDTIFQYSDAIIQYEPKTDSLFKIYFVRTDSSFRPFLADTLAIDKQLILDNVHFLGQIRGIDSLKENEFSSYEGVFFNVNFTKRVELTSVSSFIAFNSKFQGPFRFRNHEYELPVLEEFNDPDNVNVDLENNFFYGDIDIGYESKNEENRSFLSFTNNKVEIEKHLGTYAFSIFIRNVRELRIKNNQIETKTRNSLNIKSAQWIMLAENEFNRLVDIELERIYGLRRLQFFDNRFKGLVLLNLFDGTWPGRIGYEQFEGTLIADGGYGPYISDLFSKNRIKAIVNGDNQEFYSAYYDSVRIAYKESFLGEMALRGKFKNHYKSINDIDNANAAYIDLKNLETRRMAYLYANNPTFKAYFKWKINQFLSLFVDYGTEPAKAIVISIYVVLAFAFIYLFYPNYWDSHGQMRIMNRYRFFLNYLNRNEGASEVYLEEREKALLPFHDFRAYLEEKGKTAPRFFYLTAMPLYKWSISGSRLMSSLLSKVDVLKGKWSEIPESGRWITTSLIITTFIIALFYDLFIKALNAIMLSINTFTTLGFGEIPIKGLPRYLAIIEGFIGWFMLTIFSVSLISQLLN